VAVSINTFTVDGKSSTKAGSHGTVTLEWIVEGASALEMKKSGPGPGVGELRQPSPSGVLRESRELAFNVWSTRPIATTTYTLIAKAPDGTNAKRAVTISTQMNSRNGALMDLQDTVLRRYGDLDINALKKDSFRRNDDKSNPKYRFTHMNFCAGIVKGVALGSIAGGLVAGASQGAVAGPIGIAAGAVAGFAVGAMSSKNLCFKFNGIPFAKQDDIDLMEKEEHDGRATNALLDLSDPSMLFFNKNDRLIGCGYFRHHLNDPAIFGANLPLAVAEWFHHVEGTHTADGGFKPAKKGGGKFHATAWDVHVYFNTDSKNRVCGVPMVGMTTRRADLDRPENVPLSTADKVVGRTFCDGGESTDGLYVYP